MLDRQTKFHVNAGLHSFSTSVAMSTAGAGRLRTAAPAKVSPAFVGRHIGIQLQNSSFGAFHAYIESIKAYLPTVEFKLPRVIVVGGRSAGKSSLLEMITKCPIFPRHKDFCTKLPIKLQLRRAASADQSTVTVSFQGKMQQVEMSQILTEVDRVMQSVTGITEEPLIVNICKVNFGLSALDSPFAACNMFLEFILKSCGCLSFLLATTPVHLPGLASVGESLNPAV